MKEEVLPDEKLEAMLNRLRFKVPNIKCPSGHKVTRLCVSSKCNNALRCDDEKCKDCGRTLHKICGFMPLKDMTDLMN
jgi:hypothetical protein